MLLLLSAVWCLSGCSSQEEDPTARHTVSEGFQLLSAGNYQEAEEIFRSCTESKNSLQSAYRGLGISLMGEGRYEEAADALIQSLSYSSGIPGNTEYDTNYYLGSCYFKMEDMEAALEVYDAILALKPTDVEARQLRGTVRIAMGNYDAANEDFRKAIDVDPDDYDRLISIYQIMERYGYEEAGKVYLQEALARYEKSMSDYDHGRLSYYLGEYEEARVYLDRARSDNDYKVMVLLGKSYEKLGDVNYARNVYQSYLSTDQSHPEIYNQLGLCQLKLGDYEGALSSFEKGIAIENNDIVQSLRFNEIVACEYLGDFSKAADLMEEYLRDFPGDENAQREYIFLKTR